MRRPDAAAALDAVADCAPVQLAVFDFDGTSIAGNSPVLLVRWTSRSTTCSRTRVMLRILLWAAAYKFRLPQNESWVRATGVHGVSKAIPLEEVDAVPGGRSTTEDIAPLFRPEADAAMRRACRGRRTWSW